MPGLCPNGHVVQPHQRYCTVCGIALLGLGRGRLALPRGSDPKPPAPPVERPPDASQEPSSKEAPFREPPPTEPPPRETPPRESPPPEPPPGPVPQFPSVGSPGSHRPGSAAARRGGRAHRRTRGSLAGFVSGLADLVLLGGASIRRLGTGARARPRVDGQRAPRREVPQHS
jgi:hypothetical protein